MADTDVQEHACLYELQSEKREVALLRLCIASATGLKCFGPLICVCEKASDIREDFGEFTKRRK